MGGYGSDFVRYSAGTAQRTSCDSSPIEIQSSIPYQISKSNNQFTWVYATPPPSGCKLTEISSRHRRKGKEGFKWGGAKNSKKANVKKVTRIFPQAK